MPNVSLQQVLKQFFREAPKGGPLQEVITKPKKKTRRGRGESKNMINTKNTNLTFIGNNSAGMTGKLDSLKRVIEVFSPGVIMLQETKLKKTGENKAKRICNFRKMQRK